MNRAGTSFRRGRIALATLALYGLLLQAFLAGLSPAISSPLASGICAVAAPLGPGGSGDAHAGHDDLCRLAGCSLGPSPLPAFFETARSRPATATAVPWLPAPDVAVRARNKGSVGARGPPLA